MFDARVPYAHMVVALRFDALPKITRYVRVLDAEVPCDAFAMMLCCRRPAMLRLIESMHVSCSRHRPPAMIVAMICWRRWRMYQQHQASEVTQHSHDNGQPAGCHACATLSPLRR